MNFSRRARLARRAFTLIEIMIVVGIMGLIMATSVPFMHNLYHKEELRKAVTDIVEVCSNARAMAIMHSTRTEVVFNPKAGTLSVVGGQSVPRAPTEAPPIDNGSATPPPTPGGAGLSAKISENLVLQMLDVNLTEYKDAEEARVMFYPNGTCDELRVILHSPRRNEYRMISLEITTGLASVESDPNKFR